MVNGSEKMISFKSEDSDIRISFSAEAMNTLSSYRQTGTKTEAGGLLFAEQLYSDVIEIKCVTTPSKLDLRSRFGFKPNKRAAQKTINKFFDEGFHYIGDWHSHSQDTPIPSPKDIKTIKDIFHKSKHHLNYLVLVILSSNNDFSKTYIALTDGKDIFPCHPYTL